MSDKHDSSKVILKKITKDNLVEVAQVHMDSFSESALTKLGSAIVQRYYLWQLTGPHKNVHAVGAFVDDKCAGFSFSGVFDGSTSGFLKQNKSFLIKQVLLRPWLIFNPLFFRRLIYGLQILRRFSKKNKLLMKTSPKKSCRMEYFLLPFQINTRV